MVAYRLHCFCPSGNSYKVALALNCARLDWEPVFVDYINGAMCDPQWRHNVNEMGEAPVLEAAGKTFAQSGAILHSLAQTMGQFAPQTADERY
jgi:glutathione S-transferase